jgi:hypothetical protein
MKEINPNQRKENQSKVEDRNKNYRPDEIRQGSEKFGEKRDNQASRENREQDKQASQKQNKHK